MQNVPRHPAPSVAPPPGTPFDFAVGLLQDGALELKWKCHNPSAAVGTMYEVKRQTGTTGGFACVGTVGARSFTDGTVPAGASPVTYQLTAVRSTSRGNPAQFTVNFGAGGSEITIASVVESSPVKLAA